LISKNDIIWTLRKKPTSSLCFIDTDICYKCEHKKEILQIVFRRLNCSFIYTWNLNERLQEHEKMWIIDGLCDERGWVVDAREYDKNTRWIREKWSEVNV
jgi:hypothetical protein